jgi:hypothetical protein
MASIIDDSIGGFNMFLEKQQELPDEATITVALFDDRYDLLYDNVKIKKATKLNKDIWRPRGSTALYDAIGKTVNTEKQNLDKLGDEKPAKVLVCIVTDGQENASREYGNEQIKKLIKECEEDNWNFMYLGANQDAFSVGSSFGTSHGNAYTYNASTAGVYDMFNTVNVSATNYRNISTSDVDFDEKSKNLIVDNTTTSDANINNK